MFSVTDYVTCKAKIPPGCSFKQECSGGYCLESVRGRTLARLCSQRLSVERNRPIGVPLFFKWPYCRGPSGVVDGAYGVGVWQGGLASWAKSAPWRSPMR